MGKEESDAGGAASAEQESATTFPLDESDQRLLEALKVDSRLSFVDLAKRLGTSEGTVRSRLKRLKDRGVILRFTVRTAGTTVKAFVEVSVRSNTNTSKIATAIAAIPGVQAVYEVAGETDIVALVDVLSTLQLNDIIERVRRMDSTISTRTRLVLKEL